MTHRGIFILSLAFNFAFILGSAFLLLFRGGLVPFETWLGLHPPNKLRHPLVSVKYGANTLVNQRHYDVVFIGDSHTDFFQWSQYFRRTSCSNQGISGDTTEGVLRRLDQVRSDTPDKVFLMVGVNDLRHGRTVGQTERGYREIVRRLIRENPQTGIYVQTIFPVNDKKYPLYFPQNPVALNHEINQMNRWIAGLPKQYSRLMLIDNRPILDEKGQLPARMTVDGLHLSSRGYEKWTAHLTRYVY
ncbi:GDSL-type esterase/lipase family protein [Sporolactobacillus vineae]|uniref:GDSL-type esterase/lipase family protein n=1 Tax=Sporolactobacillus vineae TaxID=444463 RepID=UPI000287F997|nr:GDSL-type esterase/lipase family protein [Sporolactobacillus vineae]